MYSWVRMKLVGFEPVPWYSPLKRSITLSMPRYFNAEKYSSVWGIGVRRSSSPVINSVGVVTLPTYISDDCFNHWSGFSQNGASKKLYVKNGMSVSPAILIQSI